MVFPMHMLGYRANAQGIWDHTRGVRTEMRKVRTESEKIQPFCRRFQACVPLTELIFIVTIKINNRDYEGFQIPYLSDCILCANIFFLEDCAGMIFIEPLLQT